MESLRLGKHTHAICVCTELQHGQRDDLGMKVRHEKLHPISLCFGTCQKGAQPPCQAPAATARARPVVDPIREMTAWTSFTDLSRKPTCVEAADASPRVPVGSRAGACREGRDEILQLPYGDETRARRTRTNTTDATCRDERTWDDLIACQRAQVAAHDLAIVRRDELLATGGRAG